MRIKDLERIKVLLGGYEHPSINFSKSKEISKKEAQILILKVDAEINRVRTSIKLLRLYLEKKDLAKIRRNNNGNTN